MDLTGNGRYAEINLDSMSISEVHSSFFNHSTYSDIRGTKGMQTEGTYLFLDFSQSNVSNKIHKDNFSRSDYADIKVPLMRRHSSSSRDTRALSSYADLDFTRTLAKHRNVDEIGNNNNNKIHGSNQQTVYSKIRPYSVEELDQSEQEIYPKLYAKIVPKSQRNCNQQTGTKINASKSTQDIYNSVSKNNSNPNDNVFPDIKLELKPNKVPFRIRPINNTQYDSTTNNPSCENRKKAPEFCSYNNLPPKLLVPVPKTQNRNPPPIRPKPLTGHNQVPPIPPHSPLNTIQTRLIPISPIGNHDNRFPPNSPHSSNECLTSMDIIGTTPQYRRNSIGRSQSFRGPPRTSRPDKPPPPPPTKPTFHAFHPNNPIMSPKSTINSTDSSDKLNVTIPSIRTRSQGENTILDVRKHEMTPPLPVRHNAKLNFQHVYNPTPKSLRKSHSIKPIVSMETEKNSPYTLDYINNSNGTYETKLTPIPKRFLQLTNRPDLPPKPKPRVSLANENIICEGQIWKRNPKANEWSQWFAVLDLFTLKLYQSKEDQPWLTIQTSKMKEINKFLLEEAEFQLAFGLSTVMKTYFFTTDTNEQTKIWIKAITTTMS